MSDLRVPNLTRNVRLMAQLDPHSAAIGQAVRGAIAQAGLTQAEAAGRLGMALNTLSRRVNGLLPFTWPELVKVAEVTGVTCAELVMSAQRIHERDAA